MLKFFQFSFFFYFLFFTSLNLLNVFGMNPILRNENIIQKTKKLKIKKNKTKRNLKKNIFKKKEITIQKNDIIINEGISLIKKEINFAENNIKIAESYLSSIIVEKEKLINQKYQLMNTLVKISSISEKSQNSESSLFFNNIIFNLFSSRSVSEIVHSYIIFDYIPLCLNSTHENEQNIRNNLKIVVNEIEKYSKKEKEFEEYIKLEKERLSLLRGRDNSEKKLN